MSESRERPTGLPPGTVTFLFTDIEGSTKLLNELGHDFTHVLETHQKVIRDAFMEHSGIEVSTDGDAFFVVFTGALDAVRGAAAAQRALADHDWGGPRVRVRMGMHTGRGTLGGDNYVGIDVHRAARIAAAAHGGQIVMSSATAGLVERDLPDGLSLRDLGEHQLKDLEHPERIMQVCVGGLDTDFPELRSLSARPNNLPAQLSSFVDRPKELAEIKACLEANRCVTLTGPGGTGKTRLSIQVATDVLPDFADGAFVVLLSAVVDPQLVASEIATVLGLKEEGTRPMTELLQEHLSDKELLLVLDNFEQVIDAAPIVADLLSGAPKLKVIATSRSGLHIMGEQEYPVPPMHVPDPDRLPSPEGMLRYEAIALFVMRAKSVRPDFEVTDQNARSVAQICARLDGLPLAIELAAARIKLLQPADLYARLKSCLALLTGGRDLTPRQRTLRGAISWSYDLLDDAEKAFFRRLSVFAGGWSFEAAEVVADPEFELGMDTLELLDSLIDKSLIRSYETELGDTPFRMLQTIREFAMEELNASDEADAIRTRHCSYFHALSERYPTELVSSKDAVVRARYDNDNLRSALKWADESGDTETFLSFAGRMWRYWFVMGQLHEGRSVLSVALAHPDASSFPEPRARALTGLGGVTYWQSDFESTRASYEEALEQWRAIGSEPDIAEALYNLGFLATVEKRYDDGLRYHTESRELYRKLGDERGVATTALGLGINRVVARDFEPALEYADEAGVFFEPRGEWFGSMMLSFIKFQAYRFQGDWETAGGMMLQQLDDFGEDLDPASASSILDMFADVAVAKDQLDIAVQLKGAAERMKIKGGGVAPPTLIEPGDPVRAAGGRYSKEEIDALLAEGATLTWEEAAALARKLAAL